MEEILLFNTFFRSSIHALVAKIQPDKVVRWCPDSEFLHPVSSASCVQHISDLHSKFALRPHPIWKYGTVDIQSVTAENRQGKTQRRRRKKKPQDKNIMACPITWGGHKNGNIYMLLGKLCEQKMIKLSRKSENAVECDRVLKFIYDTDLRHIEAVVQASIQCATCPIVLQLVIYSFVF